MGAEHAASPERVCSDACLLRRAACDATCPIGGCTVVPQRGQSRVTAGYNCEKSGERVRVWPVSSVHKCVCVVLVMCVYWRVCTLFFVPAVCVERSVHRFFLRAPSNFF